MREPKDHGEKPTSEDFRTIIDNSGFEVNESNPKGSSIMESFVSQSDIANNLDVREMPVIDFSSGTRNRQGEGEGDVDEDGNSHIKKGQPRGGNSETHATGKRHDPPLLMRHRSKDGNLETATSLSADDTDNIVDNTNKMASEEQNDMPSLWSKPQQQVLPSLSGGGGGGGARTPNFGHKQQHGTELRARSKGGPVVGGHTMNNETVAIRQRRHSVEDVAVTNIGAASPTPPASNNQNHFFGVDDALLSALSDPRERFSLLRLEQTLIDFMKDRTAGYIEVGGPNNSVVIGGQSGGTSNNGANVGKTRSPSSQDERQFVPMCNDGPGAAKIVTNRQLQHTGASGAVNAGGNRQTSFHRLCLHRLADRFKIVRESTSTSPAGSNLGDDGVVNGKGLWTYQPGLIRLVKVKESKIPDKLLIDLDLSLLTSGPPAFTDGGGLGNGAHSNSSNINHHTINFRPAGPSRHGDSGPDGTECVKDLVTALSSSSPMITETNNAGDEVKRITNPPSSKKKMVIMKRLSSTGSLNGMERKGGSKGKDGVARHGLKGKKNLTDKEKAYAEARARIFNESGAVAEEANSPHSKGAARGGSSAAASSTGKNGGSQTVPFDSRLSQSSPSVVTPLPNGVSHETRKSQSDEFHGKNLTSDSYADGYQHRGNFNGGANSSVSKVTWRNRRQEESDPDFRRSASIRVPHALGYGMSPVHMTHVPQHQHYAVAAPSAVGLAIPGNCIAGNGVPMVGLNHSVAGMGGSVHAPSSEINHIPAARHHHGYDQVMLRNDMYMTSDVSGTNFAVSDDGTTSVQQHDGIQLQRGSVPLTRRTKNHHAQYPDSMMTNHGAGSASLPSASFPSAQQDPSVAYSIPMKTAQGHLSHHQQQSHDMNGIGNSYGRHFPSSSSQQNTQRTWPSQQKDLNDERINGNVQTFGEKLISTMDQDIGPENADRVDGIGETISNSENSTIPFVDGLGVYNPNEFPSLR